MITERKYEVFRPIKITLTSQEELVTFKYLLGLVKGTGTTESTVIAMVDTLISDMNIYE